MAESSDKDVSYSPKDEPATAGQPLSDFLLQLEDYTPTVYLILNTSATVNLGKFPLTVFFSFLSNMNISKY